MLSSGLLLMGLSVLFWFFPRALTYPLIVVLLWISLALLYRAYRLQIRGDKEQNDSPKT